MEKLPVPLAPQDFTNIHVALQSKIDSFSEMYKRYPNDIFWESLRKKFSTTQNKIKKIMDGE